MIWVGLLVGDLLAFYLAWSLARMSDIDDDEPPLRYWLRVGLGRFRDVNITTGDHRHAHS